jgi:hypothetical protein
VILTGDTSGTLTVSAPLVAGSNTVTLPAATGTISLLERATAVTASGTSIDFTSIPSWVKRVTVMFSGVSTNGTSIYQIQAGNGSVVTSGYSANVATGNSNNGVTSGFQLSVTAPAAASTYNGYFILSNITGNTWCGMFVFSNPAGATGSTGNGTIALGGTLDRIRITTVNGTDTFDAGTINIMYEG